MEATRKLRIEQDQEFELTSKTKEQKQILVGIEDELVEVEKKLKITKVYNLLQISFILIAKFFKSKSGFYT